MNFSTKISAMRDGGKQLGTILKLLLDDSTPGMSLLTIENRAQELIKKAGGKPSFQTVEGYKWATCLCVNDEIVHGIPKEYFLKPNDLLTIDIGMLYKGYHTDTAHTIKIMERGAKKRDFKDKFLTVGENALFRAIDVARSGNFVGDISQTIQKCIEGSGYCIVKSLVGHGVGKKLHEEPQIPGYQRGDVRKTMQLQEGMTIAIEVIYAEGKGHIITDANDGWTIRTRDHSRSAVFEHTIAITKEAPCVLTDRE